MRRLFIIRKDLHLSPGKLAAMVAHCSEAFWTRIIKNNLEAISDPEGNMYRLSSVFLDTDIVEKYICGIFTKTICEARNLNQLKKAENIANELGLIKGSDYDYINDKCLTELTPENEDGTCTVGIWFKPLNDEVAHKISKKFPLYRD